MQSEVNFFGAKNKPVVTQTSHPKVQGYVPAVLERRNMSTAFTKNETLSGKTSSRRLVMQRPKSTYRS